MVGKAKKAVIGLEIIPEYVDESDSFGFGVKTDDEDGFGTFEVFKTKKKLE